MALGHPRCGGHAQPTQATGTVQSLLLSPGTANLANWGLASLGQIPKAQLCSRSRTATDRRMAAEDRGKGTTCSAEFWDFACLEQTGSSKINATPGICALRWIGQAAAHPGTVTVPSAGPGGYCSAAPSCSQEMRNPLSTRTATTELPPLSLRRCLILVFLQCPWCSQPPRFIVRPWHCYCSRCNCRHPCCNLRALFSLTAGYILLCPCGYMSNNAVLQ